MVELLSGFILPIILVVLGIWLKKGVIPNTSSKGKLWLFMVIVGCAGIFLKILLLILKSPNTP